LRVGSSGLGCFCFFFSFFLFLFRFPIVIFKFYFYPFNVVLLRLAFFELRFVLCLFLPIGSSLHASWAEHGYCNGSGAFIHSSPWLFSDQLAAS
jgi:hypothetical protein